MRFADWSSLEPDQRRAAVAEAIERARLFEPWLHAYVAIAAAAPAATSGPLGGMPYAAKDIFASVGRHPTCGLGHGIDLDFPGDAEVLRRLDRAGAARIGYCTMTELAYQPSGFSTARAPALNPWNAANITGGSSSGSAVAVASGSVVFALGSDTGGSVRIPAQACGVTAWKPTAGLVPSGGAMALAPSLDTIGVLARSAADLAMPAAVLSKATAAPRPIERVAMLDDLFAAAEAPVRVACEDGVAALASTGVTITHRDAASAIETIDRDALIVLQAEAARNHRARYADPAIDPVLRKRLGKGLAIDDAGLAASLSRRTLAADFLSLIVADADAVVLPVMPITTPLCMACDPSSGSFDARTLYRLSQWTRFVNMLGFPALAMPAGFDQRGLPVALQIVGRPGSDHALIALVEAVQKRSDWHGRVPAGIADLSAPFARSKTAIQNLV